MSIDELRKQLGPDPERELRQDYGSRHAGYSWSEIGTSICLAGGAYVLFLVFVGIVVLTVDAVREALRGSPISWEGGLSALVAACGIAMFGAVAAVIYSGLLSLVTFAAASLAVRLLRIMPRDDRLGLICGGIVAYLATLTFSRGLVAEMIQFAGAEAWPLIILALLVVAILFGMVGGAIGGLESYRIRVRRLRRQSMPVEEVAAPPRFSLAQLMGLMVIASLLLAVLRATGLLNLPMLVTALIWLTVQVLGYRPAIAIARCWAKRRQDRWRRKLKESRERARRLIRSREGFNRST